MQPKFEILKGRTLTSIEPCKQDGDIVELVFKTTDGEKYKLYHGQDCCEYVRVEDICGNLSDLIGMPLLMAEVVSSQDETPKGVPQPSYSDSYTWTFYKLATNRGAVTIRWLGESNGYYCERVDFAKVG